MFEERNIKLFYSVIKEGYIFRIELISVLGRYRIFGFDYDVKVIVLSRLY